MQNPEQIGGIIEIMLALDHWDGVQDGRGGESVRVRG